MAVRVTTRTGWSGSSPAADHTMAVSSTWVTAGNKTRSDRWGHPYFLIADVQREALTVGIGQWDCHRDIAWIGVRWESL